MTLAKLAQQYNTDKLTHGYIPFYEQTLPENPARILEIGCFKGASLRMWRDYYPNAELHTLDLFVENHPPTDIRGLITHCGNQCDFMLLEQLRKYNFDVIIDDGSHNSRDQMITFFGLMHKNCHYYIEDTHCCQEEFYQQGLPYTLTADALFNILYPTMPIMVGKNIIKIEC